MSQQVKASSTFMAGSMTLFLPQLQSMIVPSLVLKIWEFCQRKGQHLFKIFLRIFYKWANPDLFLFIFGLFKHKFYRKTVGISGIRTWIVRLQGDHADNLTTTTSQMFLGVSYSQSCPCRPIVRF